MSCICLFWKCENMSVLMWSPTLWLSLFAAGSRLTMKHAVISVYTSAQNSSNSLNPTSTCLWPTNKFLWMLFPQCVHIKEGLHKSFILGRTWTLTFLLYEGSPEDMTSPGPFVFSELQHKYPTSPSENLYVYIKISLFFNKLLPPTVTGQYIILT